MLAVALPGELSDFEGTAVAEAPTLAHPADELFVGICKASRPEACTAFVSAAAFIVVARLRATQARNITFHAVFQHV